MEQEKRSLKLTIQREIKINLQKQEIFHKNEEFSDFQELISFKDKTNGIMKKQIIRIKLVNHEI